MSETAFTDPTCRILLVATYDLGHQSFGVASAAAWLHEAGYPTSVLDLSRRKLDPAVAAAADVIATYLPMHTATRLAVSVLPDLRRINPTARIVFFGLYAAANAELLRELGADAVISGEFEAQLVEYVHSLPTRLAATGRGAEAVPALQITALQRLAFRPPRRDELPALGEYPRLAVGEERRVVAYTEATRGCLHMCRHCPIPAVYGGKLRVVQPEVVLADIAAQIAAGAEHVTFGDPDFLNAPSHAIRLVQRLHTEHPSVTFDVTVKIEHLLAHRDLLPALQIAGCLFITSAVESTDDRVLAILDKGHTRADFIAAVQACSATGIVLSPTFVAFHPWLTRSALLDTFTLLEDLGLSETLAPIQLTTRLLVPDGSLLLGLPDLAGHWQPFDRSRLVHPWQHDDPAIDAMQRDFESIVADGERRGLHSRDTVDLLWRRAGGTPPVRGQAPETVVPRMLEPWFCCSEPVPELLDGWAART
jgi:radical SAM superfamily enzyme YgiQ (UPF0313 family)